MANDVLTPAEEQELAQLEALEASEQPQGDNLSPEEESELAELEALENTSVGESTARGLIQGAAFGFADEIAGGVEAALTDKSYEEARDESRAAFDRAKNANTAAFYGGEFVGGIASSIATGGAGMGVRGAAVLGGLYSIGNSNKTGVDLAEDAAIGAALGVAGEKIFRGIGQYAKKIFSNSSAPTKAVAESLSNSTDDIAASLETNWLKLAYAKGYNNADEVLTDPLWLRTVQSHVNKSPDSIKKIIKKAKDSYGHKFSNMDLSNQNVIDDLANSKALDDLISESNKSLVGTSDASKWIRKFQQDLTNGNLVGDISDGASFEQLRRVKKYISDTLFQNKLAGEQVGSAAFNDRNGNRLLVQFSSALDDRLAALDTTKTYKMVNQQFSLLRTAEQVIPQGGEKANAGEISSFFTNFGGNKGATKGSIFFENLEQFDVANGTSYAQQVIQDVKPVIDNFMLSNMASFKSSFDEATSLVFRGRALSSINPALAPLAAGEPVVVRLAHKAGKVSAKAANMFKIPRNIQGIIDNAPIISKKLSLQSPSAAISFNQAYEIATEDGDISPLENLVQQALQNPASQSQFEQGIGFEGRVTNPVELEAVRESIMERRIPLRLKIKAVNELEQNGLIPNIPEINEAPSVGRSIRSRQRDNASNNVNMVKATEKDLGE